MQSNEQYVAEAQSKLTELKKLYLDDIIAYHKICNIEGKESLLHAVLKVQQSACKYFNFADELVGKSELLGAHNKSKWVMGLAEDCCEILNSLIVHYVFLRGVDAKLGLDLGQTIEPGETSYANLQRMVKEYLPETIYQPLLEKMESNKIPTFGFKNKEKDMAAKKVTWQSIAVVVIGVVFLLLTILFALSTPNPTNFQMFICRGIFAMGLASVAAIVPGFIDVELKASFSTTSGKIVSGGAIALFVIVWFFNPPEIINSVHYEQSAK